MLLFVYICNFCIYRVILTKFGDYAAFRPKHGKIQIWRFLHLEWCLLTFLSIPNSIIWFVCLFCKFGKLDWNYTLKSVWTYCPFISTMALDAYSNCTHFTHRVLPAKICLRCSVSWDRASIIYYNYYRKFSSLGQGFQRAQQQRNVLNVIFFSY